MSLLRDLISPKNQPARSWGGLDSVLFNGTQYPLYGLNQTLGGKVENIDVGYTSLVYRAYMQNPVVFACMRVRRDLFTEARFGFQNMRGGVAGDFYGDRDRPNSVLAMLDHPWPGATTGDLLKHMITDNDLAGNAFIARRGNRLVRLRPDWTQIIHGTPDPDGNMWDPDAKLAGYSYQPGGPAFGRPWMFFLPEEVAHFSTTPDPLLPVRGMPWLSPILREIMADEAMTLHRLKYFEHGGTPNLVIKTQYNDIAKLREFMNFVRQEHEGLANAYKMMGFTAGVDATVVGSDLKQLDFKVVQGGGETRIASDAGVPPILAGLSEGLQGTSLNAGQGFAPSMRMFADLTMSSVWRNAAGSLESIIPPPTGARLWYDIRGIPALREDIKSAAEVGTLQAQAIQTYVIAGFEPESAVEAVNAGDLKRLKHTGLYSVQLQPPMPGQPTPPTPPQSPPPPPGPSRAEEQAERDRADLFALLLARSAESASSHDVRFAEGAIRVDSPVTIEQGAFRAETPVTIAEGAVRVDSPVTIAAGAVQVDAPVTIGEGAVHVDSPVSVNVEPTPMTVENRIEPTPVTIRNEVTIEPTPVIVEPTPIEVRNEVTVAPTPVEITNEVTVEPTPVAITQGDVHVAAKNSCSG